MESHEIYLKLKQYKLEKKNFAEIYKPNLIQQYKFIPNIVNIVNKNNYNNRNIVKLYKHIKNYLKNPIPESVIQLFYEDPEIFFLLPKIIYQILLYMILAEIQYSLIILTFYIRS